MRPLAKAAIKGGFMVKDATLGAVSLAGTQVEKLTGPGEVEPAPKAKAKPSKPGPEESVVEPKTPEA
jgi:hypothetical protein